MEALREGRMAPTFQIWDRTINNIVDEYTSETEALRVLQNWLDQYGPDELESLALTRELGGGMEPVAAGADLIAYLRTHGAAMFPEPVPDAS